MTFWEPIIDISPQLTRTRSFSERDSPRFGEYAFSKSHILVEQSCMTRSYSSRSDKMFESVDNNNNSVLDFVNEVFPEKIRNDCISLPPARVQKSYVSLPFDFSIKDKVSFVFNSKNDYRLDVTMKKNGIIDSLYPHTINDETIEIPSDTHVYESLISHKFPSFSLKQVEELEKLNQTSLLLTNFSKIIDNIFELTNTGVIPIAYIYLRGPNIWIILHNSDMKNLEIVCNHSSNSIRKELTDANVSFTMPNEYIPSPKLSNFNNFSGSRSPRFGTPPPYLGRDFNSPISNTSCSEVPLRFSCLKIASNRKNVINFFDWLKNRQHFNCPFIYSPSPFYNSTSYELELIVRKKSIEKLEFCIEDYVFPWITYKIDKFLRESLKDYEFSCATINYTESLNQAINREDNQLMNGNQLKRNPHVPSEFWLKNNVITVEECSIKKPTYLS
eukprot:TRINITY_DN1037_c0_g1_i1.p1 TRINITY_DN1037_c0_g1~~TRINITY_DN1037_c0_g1_i1.p1  ORF type:complete len:444 (-),score=113.06 TRINITY_DN1037_c0_g1_i1:104-1435(-)